MDRATGHTSISITAKSVPFHDDPNHASEFYETLGRIVCLWGRFEFQVALALVTMQSFPECKPIAKSLPMPWKRKAELWNEVFNKVEFFRERRDDAIQFMNQASAVAEDRNLLQHSQWFGFENNDPLAAQFRGVKQVGDMLKFTRSSVSLLDLKAILTKIDNLSVRMLSFTWWLSDLQLHHPELSKSQPTV